MKFLLLWMRHEQWCYLRLQGSLKPDQSNTQVPWWHFMWGWGCPRGEDLTASLFAFLELRPFSPSAAQTDTGSSKSYRAKPKCISISWRSLLHQATHPRVHIQGCLQGSPQEPRLPDNTGQVGEPDFAFFVTNFMTPSSLKRARGHLSSSSVPWGFAWCLGKAEPAGLTGQGFAFAAKPRYYSYYNHT